MFVEWKCRVLLNDENPDVCSDAELIVAAECMEAHPELQSDSCMSRLEAQERQEATHRLLSWVVPVVVVLLVAVLIAAVLIVRRWRANLLRSSIVIPFEDVHVLEVQGGTQHTTTFNALAILAAKPHPISLKFAEWRGTKVQPLSGTLLVTRPNAKQPPG